MNFIPPVTDSSRCVMASKLLISTTRVMGVNSNVKLNRPGTASPPHLAGRELLPLRGPHQRVAKIGLGVTEAAKSRWRGPGGPA